jgi:hypothetical protein
MKNFNYLTLITVIGATVMLYACGGGGAKNEYLGNLPGLYEKFSNEEANVKASLKDEKDMSKLTKAFEEMTAKEKQLEADVAAEVAKIAGREIPVTYSDALTSSGGQYFNAKAVTAENKRGGLNLVVSLTAKDAFTSTEAQAKEWVCYYLADKDGAPIEGTRWGTAPLYNKTAAAFGAGDQIDKLDRYLDIKKNPAGYAKLASVRFVTREEYDNAK